MGGGGVILSSLFSKPPASLAVPYTVETLDAVILRGFVSR